jgi:hypothetical protein
MTHGHGDAPQFRLPLRQAAAQSDGWATELAEWSKEGHPCFGRTKRQLRGLAVIWCGFFAAIGLAALALPGLWTYLAFLVGPAAVSIGAELRRRAVLTPAELVLRAGPIGGRRLPWASITAIEVYRAKRALGGRLLRVHEESGHRTTLLAPVAGGFDMPADPDFDAKVEAIREWWVLHRGPDWRPAGGARARSGVEPYTAP